MTDQWAEERARDWRALAENLRYRASQAGTDSLRERLHARADERVACARELEEQLHREAVSGGGASGAAAARPRIGR